MYGYNFIAPEYYTMGEASKKLNIKGYGRNNLYKFLIEKRILDWIRNPVDKYVRSGYFKKVINLVAPKPDYFWGTSACRVSEAGIEFIRNLILQDKKQ